MAEACGWYEHEKLCTRILFFYKTKSVSLFYTEVVMLLGMFLSEGADAGTILWKFYKKWLTGTLYDCIIQLYSRITKNYFTKGSVNKKHCLCCVWEGLK